MKNRHFIRQKKSLADKYIKEKCDKLANFFLEQVDKIKNK